MKDWSEIKYLYFAASLLSLFSLSHTSSTNYASQLELNWYVIVYEASLLMNNERSTHSFFFSLFFFWNFGNQALTSNFRPLPIIQLSLNVKIKVINRSLHFPRLCHVPWPQLEMKLDMYKKFNVHTKTSEQISTSSVWDQYLWLILTVIFWFKLKNNLSWYFPLFPIVFTNICNCNDILRMKIFKIRGCWYERSGDSVQLFSFKGKLVYYEL